MWPGPRRTGSWPTSAAAGRPARPATKKSRSRCCGCTASRAMRPTWSWRSSSSSSAAARGSLPPPSCARTGMSRSARRSWPGDGRRTWPRTPTTIRARSHRTMRLPNPVTPHSAGLPARWRGNTSSSTRPCAGRPSRWDTRSASATCRPRSPCSTACRGTRRCSPRCTRPGSAWWRGACTSPAGPARCPAWRASAATTSWIPKSRTRRPAPRSRAWPGTGRWR